MSHAVKTILVSGATGKQGGALVKHLLKGQWRIRALTRNPSSPAAQELSRRGVEVVQGDMDDLESLKRAMKTLEQWLYSGCHKRARRFTLPPE